MRLRFIAAIAAAAIGFAVAQDVAMARKISTKQVAQYRFNIKVERQATWSWQDLSLVKRTPSHFYELKLTSPGYLRWLNRLWLSRLQVARAYAQNPPHLREWLCIHHYEGSWTDPNAPYFGGLQMDQAFMMTYGANLLRTKGTADHWTPLEQMWVAERAYRSGRGFNPWPNTAHYCGLL